MHPVTALLYLAVMGVLSFALDHPLYLAGILGVVVIAIVQVDEKKTFYSYIKIGLFILALIMIVNPLVNKAGQTILWRGPYLPLLGRISVSLEAVVYSTAMGLRLFSVLLLICLYQLMVDPDQQFDIFSRVAKRSGLTVSLTARLFPQLAERLREITDVQKIRGVRLDSGTRREKIRKRLPLLKILLITSLEGSLQMAEAIEARGYGSGSRSFYEINIFRPRDYLILTSTFLALGAGLVGITQGWGVYRFYPVLGPWVDSFPEFLWMILIEIILAVPLGLNWGWEIWPFIRSKI